MPKETKQNTQLSNPYTHCLELKSEDVSIIYLRKKQYKGISKLLREGSGNIFFEVNNNTIPSNSVNIIRPINNDEHISLNELSRYAKN